MARDVFTGPLVKNNEHVPNGGSGLFQAWSPPGFNVICFSSHELFANPLSRTMKLMENIRTEKQSTKTTDDGMALNLA